MWRVSYQDYRGWRSSSIAENHPPVKVEDFQTKEEAESAKRTAVYAGLTACITPTPLAKVRKRNQKIEV